MKAGAVRRKTRLQETGDQYVIGGSVDFNNKIRINNNYYSYNYSYSSMTSVAYGMHRARLHGLRADS
jgi:hypothetical protein